MTPVSCPHRHCAGRAIVASVLAALLCLVLIAERAWADGPWEGVWQTTYGPVHLRQDGRRVWGDYRNTGGVIEARTTPDGLGLRGTYLRGDDRWGWVSFTLNANGWRGIWRDNDIPQDGDSAWNATARLQAGPPELRHATGPGPFWPPTYAGAPFGHHAQFAFGPDGRDPYIGSAQDHGDASGTWYGSYDSDPFPSGYMVSVAVDDRQGPDRAIVELSFFAPSGTSSQAADLCPAAMHPAFCDDLHARFGRDNASRTDIEVRVAGSLVDTGAVQVAFHLSGDAAPRLLELRRRASDGRVTMSVWHPQRGVDFVADVLLLPHPCDGLGTCDPFRLSGSEGRLGPLARLSFADAMRSLPDGRAAAHGGATPPPAHAPRTTGIVTMDDGDYEVLDQFGSYLGTLALSQGPDGRVSGDGLMIPTAALAGQSTREVIVRTNRVTADALDMALIFDFGGPQQRLLIGRDGTGDWSGTLLRDADWVPVTLFAVGETYDLPGFGIYAPNYQLRNTAGNPARLRTAPRSDAPSAGTIMPSSQTINVLQCLPDIDSLEWEESSLANRLQRLDAVWCEVVHDAGQQPGWLPGHFLEPVPQ